MQLKLFIYLSLTILALSQTHAIPNYYPNGSPASSLGQYDTSNPGNRIYMDKRAAAPGGSNEKLIEQIKKDPAVQSVIDFLIQTIIASVSQQHPAATTAASAPSSRAAKAPAKEEEEEEEEGGGEEP
ncbi:hypothetical protein BD560DRAFT_438646 [Blakeslea trispora]|nr:hypothetical protein BD560DRAFT_438646 [Blakeslea trispora]